MRLSAALARRIEAWAARQPGMPRTALLLQLLEAGLREAEARPLAGGGTRGSVAPLPHRRLRAQAAVYLPASPYAALHGLRPRHHLALERSLEAALEGEASEPGGVSAGPGEIDDGLGEA